MTKTIIEILIDSSGSMGYMKGGGGDEYKFLIDGKTRMSFLKRMLIEEILPTIDYTASVHIRTFRIDLKFKDNKATSYRKNISAIYEGSFDFEKIKNLVSQIEDPPLGGTPITAALEVAMKNLIRYPEYDRKIILLTDGEESGGGDYIKKAKEIAQLVGTTCKIFIIGIALTEKAEKAAKEIATGGFINVTSDTFKAKEVKQLTATIKTAVLEDTISKITKQPKEYRPLSDTNTEKIVREKIERINRPVKPKRPEIVPVPEIRPSETIHSEPNPNQTDDLKINFTPNNLFQQDESYRYPVVKMPNKDSGLKLPRQGRSNQRGYKDMDFYTLIKSEFRDLVTESEVHLTIPFYNKPYEPDILLIDENLNLYIDIEIDEPYDGYYRFPTHEQGKDDTRDSFFTECGWIVIRFTERQVHEQPDKCLNYIRRVLNSIYNGTIAPTACPIMVPQWDYQQAIRWEKEFYREKYLGIEKFGKRNLSVEIIVDINGDEIVEKNIDRKIVYQADKNVISPSFEEEEHIYRHPLDVTGNAEYISATTLIDRFFPFDQDRYIKQKAKTENRKEQEVLDEFIRNRDEAAEKGTYLHAQIEKFLKGEEHDYDFKEFRMFQNFYAEVIVRNGFEFQEAEKIILHPKHNVAGMVDALFKKSGSDEHIILDWKRSKKLVIDGHPRKFGYGNALSELSDLDNSSFYKYSLQQNLYRYILENQYGYKISSMKLIVLHEKYDKYFIVSVDKMDKEIKKLIESLNHKI